MAKKLAVAGVICIVALVLALFFTYGLLSTQDDGLLIAGTTPIKVGDNYKYSVSLIQQPPYYQSFTIKNNYTLSKLSLFIIQLNRSIDLQVTLSEFDPEHALNNSYINDIGSIIVSNRSMQYNTPTWLDIPFINIPLSKGKSYKITVTPYPEQGGQSYRWFVANDTYPGGQLYLFTESEKIQGPLSMETDAAFRLWGNLSA